MSKNAFVRAGHATLVAGIVISTASGALFFASSPTASAATSSAPASSAQTLTWDDGTRDPSDPDYATFKDLTVTVSQTENLVNQGVVIDWAGAGATSPGEYASNYLQVMQCWGDDPAGPIQQNCEFGSPNTAIAALMGGNTAARDLNVNQDPAQVYSADLRVPPPRGSNRVSYRYPFTSVKGITSFDQKDFFTSDTSNEVDALRTGQDGTGSATFEMQTSIEAPQLGCGDLVTTAGVTAPRSCWLVIVPRGTTSIDGTPASAGSGGRLYGSPLSASAWKNRMVVKMGFQSVASECTIGAQERRVVGSELMSDAFTSWQSALCGLGTTYGYSQIGDPQGRRTILAPIDGGSKLAFVTNPVDSASAGDADLLYAPTAQTSLVVGFNIDYSLNSDAANFSKNGTQVKDLVLNARLVAKLLTQSYRFDVPGLGTGNTSVAGNPRSIVTDPEFLSLNPNFVGFTSLSAPDGLMVALGSSDANALVWKWLRSDPLAKSFLAGQPDDWGMKINSAYLSLHLDSDTATDSYPKADLTTSRVDPAPPPGFGTLDLRPYTLDMREAAYRSLKGDANVKIVWDETKAPPAYVSSGAQLPGQRFELSLTDAASAARYGLGVAKLVNAAGQAVAPTVSSVTTTIAAMATTKSGVKVPDPGARTVGAYPLAMPVYAAINVCEAPKDARADYAKLLTYAAGTGQSLGDARGQLPDGYVPLSTAQVKQTKAAAATLTAEAAGTGECDKPEPTPSPTPTGTPTPTPTPTDTAPAVVPPVVPPAVPPVVAPVPSDSPAPTPSATVQDPEVVATQYTSSYEGTPLGARIALAGAFLFGVPSMIVGPLLSRHGRRLARLEDLP